MLIRTPPTSSTERVRQFRQRNPGYDRRQMAYQRAKLNEAFARLQAETLAAAQAVAPAEPLMLPAPVAEAMMAQLNGLAALRESQPRPSLCQSPSSEMQHACGEQSEVRMQNEEKTMRTLDVELPTSK